MNKKYMLLALTLMSCFTCSAVFTVEKQESDVEKRLSFDEPEVKRISEAFGHLVGSQLDNPGFKYDLESFVKGIRDAAAGKESPMTEEEYERAAVLIQENIVSEVSSSNLRKADEFMRENAHDRNVVEVETGKLQYVILSDGEGPEINAHDVPLIHYTAKYLDGTVFGSSVESGSPISLPLDQTLPGLKQGLIGTKEGEKRRLFIHPTLAHGANGLNSLLIFEVEVIRADTLADLEETYKKENEQKAKETLAEQEREILAEDKTEPVAEENKKSSIEEAKSPVAEQKRDAATEKKKDRVAKKSPAAAEKKTKELSLKEKKAASKMKGKAKNREIPKSEVSVEDGEEPEEVQAVQ
jgi:peptidylprolyl isomerase